MATPHAPAPKQYRDQSAIPDADGISSDSETEAVERARSVRSPARVAVSQKPSVGRWFTQARFPWSRLERGPIGQPLLALSSDTRRPLFEYRALGEGPPAPGSSRSSTPHGPVADRFDLLGNNERWRTVTPCPGNTITDTSIRRIHVNRMRFRADPFTAAPRLPGVPGEVSDT